MTEGEMSDDSKKMVKGNRKAGRGTIYTQENHNTFF
jgi:hypothetical protein